MLYSTTINYSEWSNNENSAQNNNTFFVTLLLPLLLLLVVIYDCDGTYVQGPSSSLSVDAFTVAIASPWVRRVYSIESVQQITIHDNIAISIVCRVERETRPLGTIRMTISYCCCIISRSSKSVSYMNKVIDIDTFQRYSSTLFDE